MYKRQGVGGVSVIVAGDISLLLSWALPHNELIFRNSVTEYFGTSYARISTILPAGGPPEIAQQYGSTAWYS